MITNTTRVVFVATNHEEAPYLGRVVLDHIIGDCVWAHDVMFGNPIEMSLSEFERCYAPEPDKSWDTFMARVPHPGLDGDGI
jgi:hypothetical protein